MKEKGLEDGKRENKMIFEGVFPILLLDIEISAG
jgi:hypothetical protein